MEQRIVFDSAEYEAFKRDYPSFRRHVVSIQRRGNDATGFDLAKMVGQHVRDAQRGGAAGLTGWHVSVLDGDGMSWSAMAVLESVADADGLWRGHLIGDSGDDQEPQIFRLFGTRSILHAARTSNYRSDLHPSSALSTIAAALAAIFFGIVAYVASSLGKPTAAGPRLVIIATAVVVAGLAVKLLERKLFGSKRADVCVRDIAKSLSEVKVEDRDRAEYKNFYLELARLFTALPPRRLLVVDGFGRLDFFTRQVLIQYLTKFTVEPFRPPNQKKKIPKLTADWEFMVVFENPSTPLLANELRNYPERRGYSKISQVRQLPLTEVNRRILAERHGDPTLAHLTAVKYVCRPGTSTLTQISAQLQTCRSPDRQRDTDGSLMEILVYLVAANAYERGSPAWKPDHLASLLAEQGRNCAHVLADMLGRASAEQIPSKSEWRTAIADAVKNFEGVIIEGAPSSAQYEAGSRSFIVTEEAARAIATNTSALGLPAPINAHRYWALYIYDRVRNSNEPFWIRKLTGHVLHCASAAQPDRSTGTPFTSDLMDMLLHCLSQCVVKAQISDARPLVSAAVALQEHLSSAQRLKLRQLSSALFALTGEPSFVAAAVGQASKLPKTTTLPESVGSANTDAGVCFIDSVDCTDYERLAINAIYRSADQRDCALVDNLNARGIENALALLRAVHADDRSDPCLAYWAQLVAHADTDLQRILDNALSRLQESVVATRTPSVKAWRQLIESRDLLVDLMTVSSALISSVVNVQEAMTNGELPSARVAQICASTEMALTAAAFGRDASTVEAGIGEIAISSLCYDLTLAGAWVFAYFDYLVRTERIAAESEDAAAVTSLNSVVIELLAEEDLPVSNNATIGGLLADRDLLLHATWAAVGFEYLGSRSILRAALILELMDGARDAVRKPVEHLAENDDGDAFLAGAFIASTRAETHQLRSAYAWNCIGRLARRRISVSLRARLGLLSLALQHYFLSSAEPDEALGWLAATAADDEPVVGLLLASVPDDDLPLVVEYLLEAIRSSAKPNGTIMTEARRATDRLTGTERDHAECSFQLFSLARRNKEHQTVDIDHELNSWRGVEDRQFVWLLVLLSAADGASTNQKLLDALERVRERFAELVGSNMVVLLTRYWHLLDEGGLPNSEQTLVEVRNTLFTIMRVFVDGHLVESVLSLPVAIEALELLDGFSDRALHNQLVLAKTQKLEADRVTVLPALASRGRYWELLGYYLSELEIWNPAIVEVGSAVVEAASLQNDLLQGNAAMPSSLVVIEGGYALSAGFLQWGLALTQIADNSHPAIAEARERVDDESARAVGQLLAGAVPFGRLPNLIRNVLNRHRAQYGVGEESLV